MPVLGGFGAARELRRLLPEMTVIFLSQHSERAYIDEAFQVGARAYILKRKASRDLPEAIRAVLDGHSYLSPGIPSIRSDARFA